MKRHGFTLIEIAAVLTIMGMLSAATILSLAHTARVHRFDAECEELAHADYWARSVARQSGRAYELNFDLDHATVGWQAPGDEDPTTLVRLADSDELIMRTADQQFSNGKTAIDCSPIGYSQSYALRLSRGNENRWMIVAGLSGKVFWTNDEKQVDAIFNALAGKQATSASNDAH
jgi:prepilin-type N-terminal cleavage/methylation domain-containing protein